MSGPADSIRRALVYAQEGNVLGPREAAVALAELGALETQLTRARREERERCASAAWLWWRDRDPDCDDGDSLRDALRALGDE